MARDQKKASYFTYRAIGTGFLLGAFLAPCNIYSGLKIGFSFNMSISAVLLSYAFWNLLARFKWAKPWGMSENVINQTAASSAGSILSAGLVAPIPALAILTGSQLQYPILAIWVFSVSLTGILVAIGIRKQMLYREDLPFPNGYATAETLREIYAVGKQAASRVRMLFYGILASAGLKFYTTFIYAIPSYFFPYSVNLQNNALAINVVNARNVGFSLEPSLMMFGFGGIVGIRVGASLLLGSIISWFLLVPMILNQEWIDSSTLSPGSFWFGSLVEWFIWPGIVLMLVSALSSAIIRFFLSIKQGMSKSTQDFDYVPIFTVKQFLLASACSMAITVSAQYFIFGIELYYGVIAFGLTFFLAIVAARVSGETGIPPIGALGKLTQLVFGLLIPGSVTHNLMSANVTGGASGQCSDLLHDLKAGQILGINPKFQVLAQVFGVLSGSLAGCAAYLILIPDPASMLLTAEWPAPAVATWMSVAELFRDGLHAFPPGTITAMYLCAGMGLLLSILEIFLPNKWSRMVPSASSIGLAFVIPASICIAMFFGAVIRVIFEKIFPSSGKRNTLILSSGLVAGEGIAGVVLAIHSFIIS